MKAELSEPLNKPDGERKNAVRKRLARRLLSWTVRQSITKPWIGAKTDNTINTAFERTVTLDCT